MTCRLPRRVAVAFPVLSLTLKDAPFSAPASPGPHQSEASQPPGARMAPYGSTITFAGPVEDHGQTLILSTGGGYHFVLAGMTKIYGVENRKVLEGEPVGVMGASAEDVRNPDVPGAPGTGDASSADAGPELYFEIRKNHKPIDPLPWLATARLERTSQ